MNTLWFVSLFLPDRSGRRAFLFFFLALVCLSAGCVTFGAADQTSAVRPLVITGRFNNTEIRESSGLVKSRKHPGVFWTINDSGNAPKIYPVDFFGKMFSKKGIVVKGAANVDWEDITADDKGNLIIGDIGNNKSKRRDLCVYIVPEPDPRLESACVAGKVRFRYPEQKRFWGYKYDSEALFWANGRLYLITKNILSGCSALYRFDDLSENHVVDLSLIEVFNSGAPVTAASADESGRLAVLTYSSIMIFEGNEDRSWLRNRIGFLRISAGQCEAVCFDGDKLMLANEEGYLYRIGIEEILTDKKAR